MQCSGGEFVFFTNTFACSDIFAVCDAQPVGGVPGRGVGRLGEFKESGGESERQTCSPGLLFRFYLHVGLVSATQIPGVFDQHLNL